MRALLQNTWSILRASGETLKRNPRLMLLPSVSSLPVVSAMGWSMVQGRLRAYACLPEGASLSENGPINLADRSAYFACLDAAQWPDWQRRAVFLGMTMLTVFLASAFVHSVFAVFRDQRASAVQSIRAVMPRVPALIAFSLVLAILQRVNLAELPFIYFCCFFSPLAVAWTLISVLFHPALVREKRGFFRTLARSASSLRRTWLPTLAIVLVTSLVVLPWMPATLYGLGRAEDLILAGRLAAGTTVGTGVVLLTSLTYALIVSGFGIFSAALYSFIVEGTVPAPFDDAALAMEWRVRSRENKTADGDTHDLSALFAAR